MTAEDREIALRRAQVHTPPPRWPGAEVALLAAIWVGRHQIRAHLPPDPPPPPVAEEVEQVVAFLVGDPAGSPAPRPGPAPAPQGPPAPPRPAPAPAPARPASAAAAPPAPAPPAAPPVQAAPEGPPAVPAAPTGGEPVAAPVSAVSLGPPGPGAPGGGAGGDGDGPIAGAPPYGAAPGGHTALAGIAPMPFVALSSPTGPGPEVARTEVSQAQWMALMGLDLEVMSGKFNQPAAPVGFCDALRYANLLSRRERLRPAYTVPEDCEGGGRVVWDTRADGYRLPTEVEWVGFAHGDPSPHRQANTNNLGLADVQGAASGLGLVGTAGNAAEWVWTDAVDSAGRRRVAAAAPVVRRCPGEGPSCRAEASRARRPLGVGLRLARNPPAR